MEAAKSPALEEDKSILRRLGQTQGSSDCLTLPDQPQLHLLSGSQGSCVEFPNEVVSGKVPASLGPLGQHVGLGETKVGCVLLESKASDLSPSPEYRDRPEGSAVGVLLEGSSPVSWSQFTPFLWGQAPASAAHSI